MRYEIRFSSSIAERLEAYFSSGKLWEMQPRLAIRCSISDTGVNDTILGPQDIAELSVPRFLQSFFSALPYSMDFGGIVGWSKLFFQELARRKDIDSLVGLSNYIFKSLCLDVYELPVLIAEKTLRVCQELHYLANLEVHDIRTKDLEYYRIPITLDATLATVSVDRTDESVVFIFLTKNYLDNFAIWLDMYQRIDLPGKHLLVMAIEEPFSAGESFSANVLEMCRQRGATFAKVFEWNPPCKISVAGNGLDLAFLWYVKIHVVANLVKRGLRVTYSDLDAYWIKDFFHLWQNVRSSTNADLVLSPTFDMPKTAILNWTFAPCAGFFSVEPTQRAKEFLTDWRRMTEIMFDDQIGLSELLFRCGIVWRVAECASVSLIGNVIMKSGHSATLVVLDPEIAKRVGVADTQSIGSATIWHPRWVMDPDQHQKAIRYLTNS